MEEGRGMDFTTVGSVDWHGTSRATCTVHGEVTGELTVSVLGEPVYTSGAICPKCYVDWVKRSVRAVTPITEK